MRTVMILTPMKSRKAIRDNFRGINCQARASSFGVLGENECMWFLLRVERDYLMTGYIRAANSAK
jgi:hypothetical protein